MASVLAIGTSLLVTAPAARATTISDPINWGAQYEHPQAGYVQYDPRPNAVVSFPCADLPLESTNPRLTAGFTWNNLSRIQGFTDPLDWYIDNPPLNNDVSYEHETEFQSDNPGFYEDTTITNIPNYYQDTDFDDEPGQFSRAGGSYRARNLLVHVLYAYQLELLACPLPFVQRLRVRAQVSYHNGTCAFGYEYCVTGYHGWPRDLAPYSAGMWTSNTVPVTYPWYTNALANPGFDNGSSSPWLVASPPGTSATAVRTAGGQWDGTHQMQLNCGGAATGCAIYQDVPWDMAPTDIWEAHSKVRCTKPGAPSGWCTVIVGIYNMANGESVTQTRHNDYVSGSWAWTHFEFRASGWTNTAPSTVRFAVFNMSPAATVFIDMNTLFWTDNQ